jgi:hypothetical protein
MKRALLWSFLSACASAAPSGAAEGVAPATPPPAEAAAEPEAPPEEVPLTCRWSESRDVATIADDRLSEISGMVASRVHDGVLYVHNDSGEAVARFFAIRTDGTTLAEIVIDGAPSYDLEDVALETQDGREWIWLGDIGDNAARDGGTPRSSIAVVRAEVPPLPDAPGTIHVGSHEVFTFTYPDAPHDCEALIVDPLTSDLYLLAKENAGAQRVFVAPAPHEPSSRRVLALVGEILPGRSLGDAITAADADASGRFAVRTYRRVYLFSGGETASERWGRVPLELPVIREPQSESVAFFPDGRGVYTVAEGDHETIHALDETCAP